MVPIIGGCHVGIALVNKGLGKPPCRFWYLCWNSTDTQKEMQAIAKLDPYFERTSRLASRRLKREERRGTLGEFALEPDLPPLQRIPTEESGSDLFRSDGSDAAALSYRFESPQSVMEGCSAQGSTVGPGSLDWLHWRDLR